MINAATIIATDGGLLKRPCSATTELARANVSL
jgi:hypothetical protein